MENEIKYRQKTDHSSLPGKKENSFEIHICLNKKILQKSEKAKVLGVILKEHIN